MCEKAKNSLVVSPFLSPEMGSDRGTQAVTALKEYCHVDVLTSDFCHHRKKKAKTPITDLRVNHISIPVSEYKTNTGLIRVFSHIQFVCRATAHLLISRKKYEIVYCSAPFSILAYIVFKMNPSATRVLDIVDYWPDSLPFPDRFEHYMAPFFFIWRRVNRLAIKQANYIISGSTNFLKSAENWVSKKYLKKLLYVQLFDSRFAENTIPIRKYSGEELVIAFVGNMGSLIDWGSILEIPRCANQNIVFRLVGDGDYKEALINQLTEEKIPFTYHGVVYERDRLQEIFSDAHFGYNGYTNTNASFSYKAAMYIGLGLPMLNSTEGDLWQEIHKFSSGINYREKNELCNEISNLVPAEYERMSLGVKAHKIKLRKGMDFRSFVSNVLFGIDRVQTHF